MILDTSAIVAMFLREPEAEEFAARLVRSELTFVSSVSMLECAIVLGHKLDRDMRSALRFFVQRFDVVVVAFDEAHWLAATDAWLAYGKGRHTARLNFGDCAAYATAKLAGAPLLYKGDDFSHTDVKRA